MFLSSRWIGPMLFNRTINPVIRRVGLCAVLFHPLQCCLVLSKLPPERVLCSLPGLLIALPSFPAFSAKHGLALQLALAMDESVFDDGVSFCCCDGGFSGWYSGPAIPKCTAFLCWVSALALCKSSWLLFRVFLNITTSQFDRRQHLEMASGYRRPDVDLNRSTDFGSFRKMEELSNNLDDE